MFRGKVVGRKIVIDGTLPPDGSLVTVYVDEPSEVMLTAEQVRLLEEASAACDRGEGIPWEELQKRLEKRRRERSSSSRRRRSPISKPPPSGGP